MQGLIEHSDNRPVLWTGLPRDEEGTCDGCAQGKRLVAAYIPTSAWLCRECFALNFE